MSHTITTPTTTLIIMMMMTMRASIFFSVLKAHTRDREREREGIDKRETNTWPNSVVNFF